MSYTCDYSISMGAMVSIGGLQICGRPATKFHIKLRIEDKSWRYSARCEGHSTLADSFFGLIVSQEVWEVHQVMES
jgi:hypothetical protein